MIDEKENFVNVRNSLKNDINDIVSIDNFFDKNIQEDINDSNIVVIYLNIINQ